ncbi:MAG TPA: hypothetical protein VNS88_12320, partial [Nitrospiraceae bacterium]|nr:hypothetical protein [Nitrospiraceae bacterium]
LRWPVGGCSLGERTWRWAGEEQQSNLKVDRVRPGLYEGRPLGRTTSGSAAGWVLSDGLQNTAWMLVQVLETTGVPAQSGCLTASDADRRRVGPPPGR